MLLRETGIDGPTRRHAYPRRHASFTLADKAARKEGRVPETATQSADGKTRVLKAGAELAAFIATVNRTVADEAAIRPAVAIFKQGVNLTSRLTLNESTGWFHPLLNDVMAQGVSVVVNAIGLTSAACRAVEKITGIDHNWVFQQNLYITPREVQGFVPHCDPHVVVVAQLYGRKEWLIYDKALDNPLILDGGKEVLLADPNEELTIKERFTVEPGDVFVIPRGHFHAACAHDGASVHMAIGCAGVRPVDVIWALAGGAMERSTLRADMTPGAARKAAREYLASAAPAGPGLPRNPVAPMSVPKEPQALSFQAVLDAL